MKPTKDTQLYWLGREVRALRETLGLTPEFVGAAFNISGNKIRRFEKGENQPQDVEQIVAGYAVLAGLDDAREIYARALRSWVAKGKKPEPPEAVEQWSALADLRQRTEGFSRQHGPGKTPNSPSPQPEGETG